MSISRRQMILEEAIRKAVSAADNIIMEASDGSREETNYLTGEVARLFVQRAVQPFATEHQAKLLGLRVNR